MLLILVLFIDSSCLGNTAECLFRCRSYSAWHSLCCCCCFINFSISSG